jgi:hypothetical protein
MLSRSIIDDSRSTIDDYMSLIDNSRVMLQFVVSITIVIYDCNIFIVQAKGLSTIDFSPMTN